MANLQYTVWTSAVSTSNGPVIAEGVIAIGGASVQSSEVVDPSAGNRQRYVRLFAESNCYVTWGEDPTATNDGTSGRMMGSENPEYWEIPANNKLAVIERV